MNPHFSRAAVSAPRFLSKRLSSTATSTITVKTTPSKDHHHAQLHDSVLPKGYLLTGVHSGIKKPKAGSPKPLDLALVLSTAARPASAAACFTLNAFRAAPVVVSREVLLKNGGRSRAVVVNSGCANAVTGKKGTDDAWDMVKAGDAVLAAHGLRSNTEGTSTTNETLVMSTGVIGVPLPITKIISAISSQNSSSLPSYTLLDTPAAYEAAARAFMTTDTFPKLRARTFEINGKAYRIAGMDKGAGMIHPRMGDASSTGGLVHPSASLPSGGSPPAAGLHATLLGLILTDAPVSPRSLQSALAYAVERSFNSISVDGDMSTNDTVIVMANGAAADTSLTSEIDESTDKKAYLAFRDELTSFAIDLAKLVVRDGEGATKFIGISVENAATYADAHRLASTISTSALVKTALYGEDANWGRILSSAGSTPLSTPLDPSAVSVSFVPSPTSSNTAPLPVLVNGEPIPSGVDEERASEILGEEEFEVRVDLGGQGVGGKEGAKYWTCDFSYEYVRINGDYRS
ncbi:arginine biosynthesis bifunctional protein ARG7 [Phlebopus sp. FC_14]|nr:arginine biosynthesis bifunctional protein ARG7 [Phlebopus sp. FC_14]